MVSKAYLIQEINLKTNNEIMIINKILNKKPSFKLNSEKILHLFQQYNGENLNEDLCGELTMDKYSWKCILDNLIKDDYSENELCSIEQITRDLSNKELIHYECF